MRKDGVVTYLHGDHLGSASLATNSAGAKVSEARYLPYGGARWESGALPTDYQFTGQRKEAGIGLYDYNARFYDPLIGRFVSADTIVPGAGNPQSLNRYAYVFNNPLKYVDPSGHDPVDNREEFCEKSPLRCNPQRSPEDEGAYAETQYPLPRPPMVNQPTHSGTFIGPGPGRMVYGTATWKFFQADLGSVEGGLKPPVNVMPGSINTGELGYQLDVHIVDAGGPAGNWSLKFVSESFSGRTPIDRTIRVVGQEISTRKQTILYTTKAVRDGNNNGQSPSLLPKEPIHFLRDPVVSGYYPTARCCGSPVSIDVIVYAPNFNDPATTFLRQPFGALTIGLVKGK